MRQPFALVITILFVLGAFNFLISMQQFRISLFELSNINYDYIYVDWSKKIDLLFSSSEMPGTPVYFLGSSRTSYGIDPRYIQAPAVNLGLFSSSIQEVLETQKLLELQGMNSTLFVELNPISVSDFHIEMIQANEKDFLMKEILSGHAGFRLLFSIPLVRYRRSLSSVMISLMDPSITIEPEKKRLRMEELVQIMRDDYMGYVEFPEDIVGDKPFSDCAEMAQMSLADGQVEVGLKVLEELFGNQYRHGRRVFWLPPRHPKYRSDEYEQVLEKTLKLAKQHLIDVVNLQSDFTESDFFDCIHLNKKGAKKLTALLGEEINGIN